MKQNLSVPIFYEVDENTNSLCVSNLKELCAVRPLHKIAPQRYNLFLNEQKNVEKFMRKMEICIHSVCWNTAKNQKQYFAMQQMSLKIELDKVRNPTFC